MAPKDNQESSDGTPSLLPFIEKPPSIPETDHRLKSIRYLLFSVYRRTFGIIFIANLIAFIVVIAKDLQPTAIINAAAANVAINALARQEFFINGCFWLATSLPKSTPLSIRRIAAKVFHYGGIHSGCGVASLVWFILFVGKTTHVYATSEHHGTVSIAAIVITYLLLVILMTIVTLAHPRLRAKYHDWFDHGHRLLAWTALGLFWALLLVSANSLRAATKQSLESYIVKFPTFWFIVLATLCVISPWLWLRHLDVYPERLSEHAIRLYFTNRKPGHVVAMKVATKLTGSWHAFAVIPNDDFTACSVLVSNAGDWTEACIENQPIKVWTRGYPIHGVTYVGMAFRSLVLVATGSGIGPIIGLLTSRNCPPARVIWQTRNVRTTYGSKIHNRVLKADPDAMIIDTDTDGREDITALAWNLVKKSSAEAVIVISNPKVTKQVVFGLEARGVAAFGPIFDS